jgi:hypothetical protein
VLAAMIATNGSGFSMITATLVVLPARAVLGSRPGIEPMP